METFKDYYRTLRVHPTADDVTIKAAFRRLALKYHPDVARNQRAARQFPNIQEAYAVLADPEKRREYDRVYRDRTPAALALSPSRKRRERDDQAGSTNPAFFWVATATFIAGASASGFEDVQRSFAF